MIVFRSEIDLLDCSMEIWKFIFFIKIQRENPFENFFFFFFILDLLICFILIKFFFLFDNRKRIIKDYTIFSKLVNLSIRLLENFPSLTTELLLKVLQKLVIWKLAT